MKERVAVYPGSFDPPTVGHIQMIERASKLADRLVVGVLINNAKTPMFSLEERVEMLKGATAHLPNVEICSFEGLLVEFAKAKKADFLVRGLRSSQDFVSEREMSQVNRFLSPEVETVFLISEPEVSFISSSTVRELIKLGGDYAAMVPENVKNYIEARQ